MRRVARWVVGVLVAALAAGAVVALVGGGGGGGGAGGGAGGRSSSGGAAVDAARGGGTAAPAGAGAGAPAAEGKGADAGALGGLAVPAVDGTMVVKTARLSIEAARGGLDAAAGRVLDVTAAAGGHVQASERSDGRASFTLAVPADAFERVLADLSGIGKVASSTVTGQDVTADVVDLDARLASWRAQEAAFLDLMRSARTIADTIAIQQQLSTVRQQIEQLEGRRRLLAQRAAFSTIELGLAVRGAPAPHQPSGSVLGRAWERAAGAALAVVGGSLVVAGAAGPLGLVALVAALVWRAVRRRAGRARHAPPAAATSG